MKSGRGSGGISSWWVTDIGASGSPRGRRRAILTAFVWLIRLRTRRFTPLAEVAKTQFRVERRRTLVGLSLMAAQAFFYNAIFFTYALVLTDFYGIRADHVGWYLLPFAVGNFLGPQAEDCHCPKKLSS